MAEEKDGFEAVANEDDIKEGKLLGVVVDCQPVVLAKLDGHLYAIGGCCTHAGAELADGTLDGEILECPLHQGHFNIRTGEAVKPPPKASEPVFNVKIEDGRIWVSRKPRG